MIGHAIRIAVLVAAGASIVACKGPDQVMQSHYRLETADELISKGESLEAIELLETMLADLQPDAREFVRQRFYAYYLLTQAHLQQALIEYLPESPSRFRSRRVNPRAMTVLLTIGRTLDLMKAAQKAKPVSSEGQRLVPGRLEDIPMPDVLAQAELLVIGLYGGLRFDDKMRLKIDRLADLEELSKLETFAQVADRTRIPEGYRPWIMLGIHRYVERVDQEEAYRFAISALHHPECRFDALTRAELIDWIVNGSDLKFLCNECDEPVVPDRAQCYNCGASYVEAYGVER